MKCKIIAECATNHRGNRALARDMVLAARDCGCDAVKFQAWQVKNIKHPTPRDTERELSDADLCSLKATADRAGIGFLVSVFDEGRIDFVRNALGCREVKIPSQDLTAWGLLEKCRDAFDFVYLSTGMSKPNEIKDAAEVLYKPDDPASFCLMHCVSKYPHGASDAHLRGITTNSLYAHHVGYSDHTLGTACAFHAIHKGIYAYEGHFALEKDPADPFAMAAKTPPEMRAICEEAVATATREGNPCRDLTPADREMRWRWKNYRGENHGPDIMRTS